MTRDSPTSKSPSAAPNSPRLPLVGDWDGDGVDTVGLYDPTTTQFFLSNSNTSGVADLTVTFGAPNAGWLPVVGDWDGSGDTTIGLYDPVTAIWHLRNANTDGEADVVFVFGAPGPSSGGGQGVSGERGASPGGMRPVVGDWDGDGEVTVGLYDPQTAEWWLRNSNTTGRAIRFVFGQAGRGWLPLAGDWDADGKDSVGLYSPEDSNFHLKAALSSGDAETVFAYGTANAGWTPLIGRWVRP